MIGVVAYHPVHQVGVRSDQDAPPVHLDPFTDDRRRLGRDGRCIRQKTPVAPALARSTGSRAGRALTWNKLLASVKETADRLIV
jgi:hypothetical protein